LLLASWLSPETRIHDILPQALPSVQVLIHMRTGQRYQILQSEGGSRIGLLSAITVSRLSFLADEYVLIHVFTGKKLKKRLEDLERKAASTSPSPEQQCIQLSQQKSPVRKKVALASTPGSLSTSPQKPSSRSPQPSHQHSLSGMIPLPDSALFSDCFSRQISNSPPPVLSYPIATSGAFDFSPFTSTMEYPTATATYNPMGYSFNPYPTTSYTGTPIASYPTKTDFYPDIDANTFTFQYAATPVTNIDNNSYTESMPQVNNPFFLR
jgi:hypothetical protein